ncbi:MAG: hypothetical protein DMG68_11715 [Acidobacteria bacterium]|nr:MAG: hypothetical protein DMG68_11715 [Acidobacteriota bacterium]
MRKIAVAFGIILLLVVVAAVVFAATFNVNHYRGTIQSELQKRLGRNVTLGDMHLSVFPPRFRVQDLGIADDPAFNTQKPFVQAQELDVSVKLLPLLHKSVEIDSLELQRPNVELIKNAQGTWNFASLGNAPSENAPAKPPAPSQPSGNTTGNPPSGTPQPSSKSGQQQFSLGKLAITDGQVALTDMQTHSPRTVYDHIDVTLKDFAPDQPFSLDAAAHLPGPGNQEVRLQGQGGPLVQGQPAMTPFHGTLNLKQVGIAGLSKFLNSPALVNTDGTISGTTKIDSASGKMSANGQMTVQNAKVHGIDLGYPIAADYNVADDVASDLLSIQNANLKLGATPLVINGTVNSKPTPAILDLHVKANNVSIAEAARLAAAAGVAFAPGTDVSGNVNADIQARGPANKPALNGTVNARNVQMSGKEIPQPVQVPAMDLTLTPAEIRSNNFNVTSAGTTVATQFTLRQYLAKTPLVDATLKAPNASLPALLSMAKAYGVKGVEKLNGQGTLNLDAHASGPLQSISSNDIMRALNGTMNLNFNNVRYSGADISHQLASIAGFLKMNPNDKGFSDILKMTGNILVRNGIAQTNNLQALLDIGNVGMTGTANLVDQTLNLHVLAVLSIDFSQKMGGTGIGGYLQTALANNQGELVIPAVVTGTFQNPRFAPDVQQVAQMKLKGLVPNFNNPQGAVQGLLGGLLGQKGANPAQPQQPGQVQPQQQPQNQLQDQVNQVIGLFGGKKKQQQPPAQPQQK